ncbi:hypothetical protein [Mycetocola saprophilus]|uniref:hypothetical protein n=1 Tax=Mycetocola saprophilus TaxID=76636 RepID=UPI0004BEA349|nr:hypothetical protein [Mycetocola saprophilus]
MAESVGSILGVGMPETGVPGVTRRLNGAGVRHALFTMLSSRLGSTVILLGIAALSVATAHLGARARDIGITEAFFAGAYGDIPNYIMTLLLTLGYASAFLARSEDADGGLKLYAALRHGSYRRWSMAILVREIPHAAAFTIGVGVVLVTGSAMLDHQVPMFVAESAVFHLGLLGLFASLLVFCTLATLLVWSTRRVVLAWSITMLVAAVVGYIIPAGIGWLNIVAPYSALHDGAAVGAPIFAPAGALVAASLFAAAALWRSSAKNADGLL